jgi:hypothetical protein
MAIHNWDFSFVKISSLIEKLSKLDGINPEENTCLNNSDGVRLIEDRYFVGDRLSNAQLTLIQWLENGEELINIDTDYTSKYKDNENKKNKKNKKMKCEHETVLEIYKDVLHKEISHYRCLQCGKKENMPFGKNVVKSNREARKAAFS